MMNQNQVGRRECKGGVVAIGYLYTWENLLYEYMKKYYGRRHNVVNFSILLAWKQN